MPSDPNITLYAVGASISESELVQKAGCCITLEYEDEYGRKSKRVITHPIGNGSMDRAHLQAAHLALASVTRQMRRVANVRLFCPMAVKVIALDQADEPYYQKAAVGNEDVIGEIKKWMTFYTNLCFAPCVVDNMLGRDKARECAESQSGSDTGTVVT